MFNSKLYKTYYPIKEESEKESFIRDNFSKIHNLLHNSSSRSLASEMAVNRRCDKELKRVTTIFGNLKYGNIAHNNFINHNRYRTIGKIRKDNEIVELLEYKLENNLLTIDDTNSIIQIDNKQFHEVIKLLTCFILAVIILAVLIKTI